MRVRQLSREVVAVYTISDVSMELIVALTSSHPLTPVKVECGRRVGVPHTQWRNWMLQLTTFLSHQVRYLTLLIRPSLVQTVYRNLRRFEYTWTCSTMDMFICLTKSGACLSTGKPRTLPSTLFCLLTQQLHTYRLVNILCV